MTGKSDNGAVRGKLVPFQAHLTSLLGFSNSNFRQTLVTGESGKFGSVAADRRLRNISTVRKSTHELLAFETAF